eukprot:PhM_4_TR13356/c0_g1_i1/m.79563
MRWRGSKTLLERSFHDSRWRLDDVPGDLSPMRLPTHRAAWRKTMAPSSLLGGCRYEKSTCRWGPPTCGATAMIALSTAIAHPVGCATFFSWCAPSVIVWISEERINVNTSCTRSRRSARRAACLACSLASAVRLPPLALARFAARDPASSSSSSSSFFLLAGADESTPRASASTVWKGWACPVVLGRYGASKSAVARCMNCRTTSRRDADARTPPARPRLCLLFVLMRARYSSSSSSPPVVALLPFVAPDAGADDASLGNHMYEHTSAISVLILLRSEFHSVVAMRWRSTWRCSSSSYDAGVASCWCRMAPRMTRARRETVKLLSLTHDSTDMTMLRVKVRFWLPLSVPVMDATDELSMDPMQRIHVCSSCSTDSRTVALASFRERRRDPHTVRNSAGSSSSSFERLTTTLRRLCGPLSDPVKAVMSTWRRRRKYDSETRPWWRVDRSKPYIARILPTLSTLVVTVVPPLQSLLTAAASFSRSRRTLPRKALLESCW